MADPGARTELAAFLRARRTQLDRVSLGLPEGGRRRTAGLRREEVAALSGVSVTWYTWLEQARDVQPSRQVLEALANALRLTTAERTYLLSVAGFAPGPVVGPTPAPGVQHIQHLLDALVGSPAFAIGADWTISGWNAAYAALYPPVATLPEQDRNLLWVVFTDPFVQGLLPDWEVTSRRFLAEFRAEAGPRLNQPDCLRLVARLQQHSAPFREAWSQHNIEGFTSRRRSFLTAEGELEFEHHRLAAADQRDLFVVVYTPTSSATVARLDRLSPKSCR
ncbi:helix-turn-helix transcriptional regulator [Microlunatus antarcticus]|uniref:Transcriptional regulator with XRE-family HTH domain n=1 Tax=Microlunatus antarcticus TaxID=53388 RepID=A0A7W5JVA9_9ACTN|nr:transcriptional regulator with XRE-family HTH domain [Microlunatus antarcticus]